MLYPFKEIADIPVFDKITAHQLISHLKSNLNKLTTIEKNHRVVKIEKIDTTFTIDNTFSVKAIIIATGNGAFNPKKFPVKMATEAEEKVHYYIKDPKAFTNQHVGIFGGGDSALDWALELTKNCSVSLIHRRDNFRGLESNVEKLKGLKNVEILTPYLPKNAELDDNQLKIGLKKVGTDELIYKKFDQIIVAYGFRANNRFVKDWGVNLEDSHIKVESEMRTNIPGIYAVGDAVTYSGRVPIIGVGFGEAQIAINAIMRNLFPEKTLTIHSTSL
ncbi:NAD(P)/FAD-dependent oxidoreductase [Lactobacillus hamsteri]|uniref:FAD/NAD(P)-binding domain-containing protein n=2 Tax=Lactobacillus hamsteri TaxID=96565 RepID=A0A0R1YCH7_9LACO|nr:hypothetical protein FC39_GL000426 [Lactobacillus hamsteri DSM 5661 = JCM 6256]